MQDTEYYSLRCPGRLSGFGFVRPRKLELWHRRCWMSFFLCFVVRLGAITLAGLVCLRMLCHGRGSSCASHCRMGLYGFVCLHVFGPADEFCHISVGCQALRACQFQESRAMGSSLAVLTRHPENDRSPPRHPWLSSPPPALDQDCYHSKSLDYLYSAQNIPICVSMPLTGT